jgi:hypothetical protein
MAEYAVIENGIVVNTIIAENKEVAEMITQKTCIEFSVEAGEAGVGWAYNGTTFSRPDDL